MQITNTNELKIAMNIAMNTENPSKAEAIRAIATYKWYNYYQNLHIIAGSADDIENEYLFDLLQSNFESIHDQIENLVNGYIERLNNDIDD